MTERSDEHFWYEPFNPHPLRQDFVKKLPIKKQIRYREMKEPVLDSEAYMKHPRFYPSIELQDKMANPYGKDISDLTLQGPVHIEQHYPKGWPTISSKGMTAQKIQQLEAFGFRAEELLREGSFGEIWRVTDIANNRQFAGKVLPLNRYYKEGSIKEGIAKLLHEVHVLRGLTHQHLVPIDGVIHVRDEKYGVRSLFIIILMGLCDGDITKLLAQRPGYFNEGQAHKWFAQIAGALHYLHSKRVCHMDIKPQNILFKYIPFTYKLADFGLAQVVDESDHMKGPVGHRTSLYMVPECRNIRIKSQAVLDVPKCDVYALGVTLGQTLIGMDWDKLYSRLSLKPGVRARDWVQKELIESNRFVPNQPLMRLLFGMIEDNPTQRFTMDEVVEHPWLTDTVKRSDDHFTYQPFRPVPLVDWAKDPEAIKKLPFGKFRPYEEPSLDPRVVDYINDPQKVLGELYPSTQPNTAPVWVYKLVDFGLAQVVEESGPLEKKWQGETGTYLYMAPELRTGSNRTLDLSKCDVYSLAITLGRSLIGLAQPKHIKKFAIFGQTPGLQARQWIQAELIDKNRFAFNDLIIQLLLIMIEKDPALRPNMVQITYLCRPTGAVN
ncbi:unnamed protein product [Oppiella nova]|uniref:Protein kinase domain-containing protein n=1 Tax=Oppiella nova TaxID=334625 RepID=A0A7R9QLC2_9ACAR|nr:unnamed protein product [Oppiella nova]CAG2168167.1 unnamed protein product [Oppiella nova]